MLSIPRRHLPLLVALFALVAASCAQLTDLPELADGDLSPALAQSSKIYADDGRLITTLHGEENRTIVRSLKNVPKQLRRAVIAIEDQRFYQHDGVDLRAILRAALENVSSGTIKEGGSTITQQYVKNVIIAPGGFAEKTLSRKLQEAALSRQLEKRLSKSEILLRYLNTVYFGNGAYGIQAAAKTYFGKSAKNLTVKESALIAGVIRAPETYDPFDNPEAAAVRRNQVLDRMVVNDWLAPTKAAKTAAKGLGLQATDAKDRYPAPYFVDYVQRLITYDPRFDAIGKTVKERTAALFRGGLRIHTTVNLEDQASAEAAVAAVLSFGTDPHGSLVAVEPTTGHVKAMVGGRDWFATPKEDRFAKLNLATLAEPGLGPKKNDGKAPGTGRQAGSAFKPFALVEAVEQGVPLSKTYSGKSPLVIPGADNGGDYIVRNYEGGSYGEMTLLEGTINSVNVVYAQLIEELGAQAVVDTAAEMGIRTPLLGVLSAVLGTNEVNPLDMASAYATLAAGGVYHPPVAITSIEDASGKVLYEDESRGERVIEPAVSYIVTTALQQVMLQGTGTGAQIGRPAAGKTGTAQEYRDAWFAGYTPDLATAVWVGYPEGQIEMKPSCLGSIQPCRPTRIQVTGGSWPADIWASFMLPALSDVPASSFEVAALDVVTVTIDDRNGCLAGRFTPRSHRVEAIFPAGAEPEEECRERGDGKPVPNVVGFPVDEATRILEGAGFAVAREPVVASSYPPGVVDSQDPAGGARAPKGATVVLGVSATGGSSRSSGSTEETEEDDGTTTVPDVRGLTASEAQNRLHDAGFEVDTIYERESNKGKAKGRRDRVWQQSPSGGTQAREGSTVTIWVNP